MLVLVLWVMQAIVRLLGVGVFLLYRSLKTPPDASPEHIVVTWVLFALGSAGMVFLALWVLAYAWLFCMFNC